MPQLDYHGVVNLLLFLDRPVQSYYWTPILGCEPAGGGSTRMKLTVSLLESEVECFVPDIRYLGLTELRRRGFRAAGSRLVLVYLAMVVVVAPWSYRNYQVFGEFECVGGRSFSL